VSSLTRPRALVTGSSGFVGRHLVTELIAQGYLVTGVDIREEPKNVRWPGYEHWEEDCRYWFKRELGHKFDLAFHCAAVIGGRIGIEQRPLEVAKDMELDIAYVQWLRREKPTNAVYYSSSAAYPVKLQTRDHPIVKLHEEDIDWEYLGLPDETYGWVKVTGERLMSYAPSETRTHIFRPFSGYGTDQDLDYPFPSIIARVKEYANPVEIWHDTVRDFIHIDDIVEATFAAIDADVIDPVNLCTGRATSFQQLAAMAARAMNERNETNHSYSPEIKILGGDKPAGVHYRVGDPERMFSFYKPKITIEEGIRRAVWTD
jgi:nucleoside-diphosphate-sugar epimerase